MTSNEGSPLHRFMEIKRRSSEAAQQRYTEDSRKRLDSIISKKMNTTFIGAISAFEKGFGFLWGQNKKPQERTEEEQRLYEIWKQVRDDILNNGNHQLRALKNELQNHNVSLNRHKITIVAKDDEEQ